jgi:hypothetical protein
MTDSGRFILTQNGEYVTSFDTWEEAAAAFEPTRGDRIPPGFLLEDKETGRFWHPGAPYEWEAAWT